MARRGAGSGRPGWLCHHPGGRRRYFDVPTASASYVSNATYRAYRQAVGRVEREACNHPIQGTSAEITKEAMRLFAERVDPDDGVLILAVHDELVVECRAERVDDVAHDLTAAMRDACAHWLKTVIVSEAEAVIAPCWAKA